MALINVAINFGCEYFCFVIYISEIFGRLLDVLNRVLKPFQLATTVLCAEMQALTSMVRQVVFSLRNIHLSESADDITIIAEMKVSLRARLSRRFELTRASSQMGCEFNSVNARQIVSFFDPRYKDLLFEPETARDAIRSHVLGHFADEIMKENENEIQGTAIDFLFQTAPKQTSGESQFRMYLSEPQLGHNINPFGWCVMRKSRYPALAKLAKKFLCIPASSVSSEPVFSTAGNLVSAKRSCLLLENVKLIVFLYENRDRL